MTLRYGFYGEDEAQRLFLHHYLQTVTADIELAFEQDVAFTVQYQRRHGIKLMNKKEVNKLYADACQRGLTEFQHDCFFVGRDLDDFQPAVFQRENQEMLAAMRTDLGQWAHKAVLLLPVQCIEYWLWYLEWRRQNPKSTKNINLESKTRRDAHIAVYGFAKCTTKHSSPRVEHLSTGMDADWLASRSASFLAFHNQVQSYLAALL